MDFRTQHLALVLKASGLDLEGVSTNHKIIVQKTIFLLQYFDAISLSYRYVWFLHGPFSIQLDKDFRSLVYASEIGLDSALVDSHSLSQHVIRKVKSTLKLISPPPSVQEKDWKELLASYFYFYRIEEGDSSAAISALKKNKPALEYLLPLAQEFLNSNKLSRYHKA